MFTADCETPANMQLKKELKCFLYYHLFSSVSDVEKFFFSVSVCDIYFWDHTFFFFDEWLYFCVCFHQGEEGPPSLEYIKAKDLFPQKELVKEDESLQVSLSADLWGFSSGKVLAGVYEVFWVFH